MYIFPIMIYKLYLKHQDLKVFCSEATRIINTIMYIFPFTVLVLSVGTIDRCDIIKIMT